MGDVVGEAGAMLGAGLGMGVREGLEIDTAEQGGISQPKRLCKECGQKFVDLPRHKSEAHSNTKPVYSCQFCPYTNGRSYDTKRHQEKCRRYRTRRGCPVDNRPSTNLLSHFVKNKCQYSMPAQSMAY